MPVEVRSRLVIAAYKKQEGLCLYCMDDVDESNSTWEHVIPRAWGGPASGCNSVLACEPCNNLKSQVESIVSNSLDKDLPLTSKAALFILHCSVRFRTNTQKSVLWRARYFRMAHHMLEMVDYHEAHIGSRIPDIPAKLRSKFI